MKVFRAKCEVEGIDHAGAEAMGVVEGGVVSDPVIGGVEGRQGGVLLDHEIVPEVTQARLVGGREGVIQLHG
jgi:hypothetical protein